MKPATLQLVSICLAADRFNPAARVQRGDDRSTRRGRKALAGGAVAGGRKANMGREAN